MRGAANAVLRSVYVRGVGAVTAFGLGWNESLESLNAGHSAVGPIRGFDAAGFPCGVAAEIPAPLKRALGMDASPGVSDARLAYAQSACREAWKMAALSVAGDRLGVFVGAESGRASFETVAALVQCSGPSEVFDHEIFGKAARPFAARFEFQSVSPASVASRLAGTYAATGPCQTISLACSSSAAAIAEAARSIRLGLCDAAICVGVGADVDPLMLAGFGKVSALSARGVSRPFDVQRDGFVVGEGAAAVILSSERGEACVALAGEGRSLDAHHLTAPDPQGGGAERAMRAALRGAGLERVDYVQAHGTSTPLNDAVEAAALGRVFGAAARAIPVSSVKGALGHWIAGAGALGFLCAWESIRSGTLLPTAGLQQADPLCDLQLVRGQAIRSEVHSALVNSFAFGGANCSLALRAVADV